MASAVAAADGIKQGVDTAVVDAQAATAQRAVDAGRAPPRCQPAEGANTPYPNITITTSLNFYSVLRQFLFN